ncbi:hypothetical protein CH63R_13294 [Colletotrichum higginsianum IMI 349063]|uniref:Uncharacterized protein n=1 Tax=Colletotrichum higginsianum (strain IMI 349063) TaxID=759273 RepID=A0A1B7XWL9_COLHI|nr:hypothetical protein CH63R_13294 [Colletotrichum higginsianum IMI 349063]OBR04167.1 hypothetical protein CH63R_13294 [Colletotrichum higginsianum IMI 349063]
MATVMRKGDNSQGMVGRGAAQRRETVETDETTHPLQRSTDEPELDTARNPTRKKGSQKDCRRDLV